MSRNILIVDDEPEILEILKFEFEDIGFIVNQASSGNQAFTILKKKSIDFVVSDVRMSDGSGFELLELCKENKIETPILFLTGFADITQDEAISKGAIGIESKLTAMENIVKIVVQYLEK